MADFFDINAKVICNHDELYNAFGDKATMISIGMRLTVRDRLRVGGALFLRFKELTDGDPAFQATAFTAMRSLN